MTPREKLLNTKATISYAEIEPIVGTLRRMTANGCLCELRRKYNIGDEPCLCCDAQNSLALIRKIFGKFFEVNYD